MIDFTLNAEERQPVRTVRVLDGDTEKLQIDASPLADDLGPFTTATASVESGNASVSGEALASNVYTANLTAGDRGFSQIKVTFSNATYTRAFWVKILAQEVIGVTYDYGWHYWR